MKRAASCPDPTQLRGLLDTNLSAAEQADLVQHLDSCTSCQHSLEEMAGGPAGSGAFRPAGATPPPADSAYWRALQEVQKDVLARTQITGPPDESGWTRPLSLDFLSPSDKPGSLGRIDHFEVQEVIGRGGMGVVLRAFDPCLQRAVALKVLDPEFAHTESARKRFCREARAAAAITHENVVAIHQVDEDDTTGLPYLVMQLVNGSSLQERLDRGEPLPLPEILEIGAQTAAGLAAAHKAGLIHRDIKPANILLEEGSGRVKLTDFGLARAAEDVRLTQTGFVAGTPLYMAPEQARGEAVDQRADLFSLGSVLYAMCTGKPPFAGSTPFLVLKSVTEEAPPPLQKVNPKIPDPLADLIARLLAKNPADRPQSAQEVAGQLSRALVLIQSKKMKGMYRCPRTGRLIRRRGLLDGLLTVGPLLVLITLAGLEVTELTGVTGVNAFLTGRVVGRKGPAAAEEPATPPVATLQGNAGPVWSVAFAPDGRTVAMALDDNTVKLWDVPSRQVIATLHGHRGPVWCVAFSPDGKRLATASDDKTVKLWSLPLGRSQTTLRHEDPVRGLAFSPDGWRLATGTRGGGVQIWDLDKGEVGVKTDGHEGVVVAVAFSPDGKTLASASGDKTVKLWDAATGQQRQTLPGHTGGVYALAFAPDGRTVASGSWDKTVRLWDVGTGSAVATLTGHTQDVWGVAFAPDGRTLASASEDRTVKLWDGATGQELTTLRGHTGTVYGVAFSPDGKTVASASRDGSVKLWDVPR